MSIEKYETEIQVGVDRPTLISRLPDPKMIEAVEIFLDQKKAMEISYVGPDLLRLLQLVKTNFPARFGFIETNTEGIETDFISVNGSWHRLRTGDPHLIVAVETTSGEENHHKRVATVKQALIDKDIPIIGGKCEVVIRETC